MANQGWILITPQPDRWGFEPQLLAGLTGPDAPAHVWVKTPELHGFVMKSEEYQRWMEHDGPIGAVSPSHIRAYRLDCGDQIDRLMQQLQMEFSAIVREWPLARTT